MKNKGESMSGEKLSGNTVNTGGDIQPTSTTNRPEKASKGSGKKVLATLLAIASMAGAGCEKGKKSNKESRLSEDATKQTMMSVDPSDFVPVDPNTVVSTDDVTVSTDDITEPTFETERRDNASPVILEANPEFKQNWYVYTPENTKVKPGVDSQDYRLSEAPAGAPKRPSGHFDFTKLCEDCGIDKSDIRILGGGEMVVGDKNKIGILITSDYKVGYYVGGKLMHVYRSGYEGGGMEEDGMSLCVEDGDSYKHGASLHFSDTTIGVLELMLRAYATGDTNPFD